MDKQAEQLEKASNHKSASARESVRTRFSASGSPSEAVRSKFPQAIVEAVEFGYEQTIVLTPDYLIEVCTYFKKDLQYDFLETLTAVDWPERVPRFDIVYQLLSTPHQCELRLKVRVGDKGEEHPSVPSVCAIWPGANWYEREVYD